MLQAKKSCKTRKTKPPPRHWVDWLRRRHFQHTLSFKHSNHWHLQQTRSFKHRNHWHLQQTLYFKHTHYWHDEQTIRDSKHGSHGHGKQTIPYIHTLNKYPLHRREELVISITNLTTTDTLKNLLLTSNTRTPHTPNKLLVLTSNTRTPHTPNKLFISLSQKPLTLPMNFLLKYRGFRRTDQTTPDTAYGLSSIVTRPRKIFRNVCTFLYMFL